MNEQFAQSLQSVAAAVKPAAAPSRPTTPTISDEDIYDANKLGSKVNEMAARIANEALAKDRSLNAKIFELSQEYPEIQQDGALRKAILESHNAMSESLRDTPEGYEMAVLRAVSKQGVLPKSKRNNIDPDAAAGGSGMSLASRQEPKRKVAQETLLVAQLLGRDVNNPEVLKGLEEATNRDSFNRFR
jgi:hypothetical protein